MLIRRTLLFILLASSLKAQGLFDQAVQNDEETVKSAYELGGFMRGVWFGGRRTDMDKAETKSGTAEAALKLWVRKAQFGDAFAEIRFRRGSEFGEIVHGLQLREAYINAYLGRVDIRLGHQIIVWGRADGFNPTNNLTPQNMLVRSPDEDDRREGNFAARVNVDLHPVNLEVIWVPAYAPSVLPIQAIPLPGSIIFAEMNPVRSNLAAAFGLKTELNLASFDGSVSYFYGYAPLPGIKGEIMQIGFLIHPAPYKMDAFGADFSTTLGPIGLRGEYVYRVPDGDHVAAPYIPNPDHQLVLGLDKTWGDLSVNLQYIGRRIENFRQVEEPEDFWDFPTYEIEIKNRMIAQQTSKTSHAVSFRPAWNLRHETLTLECLGMVNWTTEEWLIRPKIAYDITDDLTCTLGGEFYGGPDGTLFGAMDRALSAVFAELRASF